MPEYLTKEEIKQWRSSLEKITLEEYAARLGKVLEEQKQTNDLIDRMMKTQPVTMTMGTTMESEKLAPVKPVVKEVKTEEKPVVSKPVEKEVVKVAHVEKKVEKKEVKESKEKAVAVESFKGVEFEKPLTDREQRVFEMFYKHAGQIVYAKDLADLLELPRDYVYKYIKTLRAKIKGDKLENADKGGYVLKI
ncbi:helix-turn-helix domain-containing protein [bacterium]|nr:helix-turn-helix domain-containing protein [bacterium]